MNGTELHQLLGAYLLGGLEPAEAAAFEQHLAVCADCRQELDDLASLPALLDAIPVSDAVALTAAAAAARERTLVPPEPYPSRAGSWTSSPPAAGKCGAGGLRRWPQPPPHAWRWGSWPVRC